MNVKKLTATGALAIVLACLFLSYVFLFLGKVNSALVTFLIASAISLGALLEVRRRRQKENT